MSRNRIVIKNAAIIDGSGNGAYNADILIIDDTINAIYKGGSAENIADAGIIDAARRTVTPGFIDIHRHCDYAVFKPGFGKIELSQGITTAISGSCGLTPFPLNPAYEQGLSDLLAPCLGEKPAPVLKTGNFSDYGAYYEALGVTDLPINIGGLIGSCSTRIAVKGFANTEFTCSEIQRARAFVTGAMDTGAFGLSLGLMYMPEFFSSRDDLVQIAEAAGLYGGVLTCHIRGEGDSLCKSVSEVIDIAERVGIKLEISHFKACGANNWRKRIYEAITLIENARSRGMEIGVDFYPYSGGATTVLSLLPPSFLHRGLEPLLEFLSTSKGADALSESLLSEHSDWDNYVKSLGWDRIILASAASNEFREHTGRSIAEIASLRKYDNESNCFCDILVSERGRAGVIVKSMDQADIDDIARLPYSAIISDSLYPEGSRAHPRLYGAFPRIIRDFVKERKILPLELAVHKMTQKPAKIMGIKDRGLIKEGFKADICIFDADRVEDCATYKNPDRLGTGMDYVLVNGRISLLEGDMVIGNAGKRLHRSGKGY